MTTKTFDLAGKVAIVTGGNGGIVQFTWSCACAWAADNIQANAIQPGWIDTELTKGARRQVRGPA